MEKSSSGSLSSEELYQKMGEVAIKRISEISFNDFDAFVVRNLAFNLDKLPLDTEAKVALVDAFVAYNEALGDLNDRQDAFYDVISKLDFDAETQILIQDVLLEYEQNIESCLSQNKGIKKS